MAFKIYLYDTDFDCIGSGCLSSSYIQYMLGEAGGQDVEVHISSVGGSAFDAIAIYDLLKKYPGNITTCIDALAASAASIVAMAGNTVVMSKYALLMIHKPMVGSGGNADELMQDVQMLNIVQTRLAAIYMDKTSLDEETINSLINSVTWMTADQALDLGFIDSIEDYAAENAAVITNSALIRKYTNTAPAIYQRCINKILIPETKTTQNDNIMNVENKELIEKTNTVLDKIMNFLKKAVNKKTVTNSAALHHTGPLNVGTEVFNDEDLEDKAPDNDYEVDDSLITVKDGIVVEVKAKAKNDDDNNDDDNQDDDGDIDPGNRAALNVLNIEVTNKVSANDAVKAIMPKLTELQNQVNEQNELLIEAKSQLDAANAKLDVDREAIKKQIKSSFEPQGSKRSDRSIATKAVVPEWAKHDEKNIAGTAVQNALSRKAAEGKNK